MNPLLKMAILAGASDLVQFHLRRDSDANRLDKDGISPLMYAAARGHAEICQILLEGGADPFLQNRQGQDALALARSAGHHSVETILLEAIRKSLPTLEMEGDGHDISDESGNSPESFAEEDVDVFNWVPQTETPPPEGDPDCLKNARALNQLLASHVPIDTDADWSEVEIELPDLPARRRGPADAERGTRITHLLMRGLQSGRVSRMDLGSILQMR